MGMFREGWKFWRSYRRTRKDMKRMRKRTLKSRTTQNVAVGTGGASAVALLVVAAVRRFLWADMTPAEATAAVTALTIILTPLLSRFAAFARNPEKLN